MHSWRSYACVVDYDSLQAFYGLNTYIELLCWIVRFQEFVYKGFRGVENIHEQYELELQSHVYTVRIDV